MSDWTSSEAREFLSIIRGEAEKVVKDFGDRQSSIYACLAVVTNISESGVISVRLLSSPSDGSQDFVARNHSGSVLEVGDSVWLHYWGDYTNAYIAMRNAGDRDSDLAPEDIGAQPNDAVSSNLLIGGFDVWQRGTSFSSPLSGTYTADRWRIDYNDTGATRTISRQTFVVGQTDVPNNPTYFLRYNQSVAGSGGTFNAILQRVENVLLLSGKTVTLSFYARATSPINIFTHASQSFGSGGSEDTGLTGDTVEIGPSWSKYTQTFVIPSVFGKTIGANNFTYFGFFMPLNTAFTFDLANVQLNYGSVALPFVPRSYADELRLCMRFYQILGSFAPALVAVDELLFRSAVFPVEMRTSPTATINSQPNAGGTDGYLDRYGVGNVSVSGATITANTKELLAITKAGSFVTTAFYFGSAKLDAEL